MNVVPSPRAWELWVATVAIALCVPGVARPEQKLSGSLYVSQTYLDNVFGNYVPRSDWISSADVIAQYGVSPAVAMAYRGSIHLFAEHADLMRHTHQLGMLYSRPLSGTRNALYVGAHAQIRRDCTLYKYYDHDEWQAYVRVKHYLTPNMLWRAAYHIRSRSHPRYDEAEQRFLA